jgi:hypothetical protein
MPLVRVLMKMFGLEVIFYDVEWHTTNGRGYGKLAGNKDR